MLLAALVLTAAPVAPVTELRLRRAELGLPSADRAAVVLHGEGHGPAPALAAQRFRLGDTTVPVDGVPDLAMTPSTSTVRLAVDLARVPDGVLDLNPYAVPVHWEGLDAKGKPVLVLAGILNLADQGQVELPARQMVELYASLADYSATPQGLQVHVRVLLNLTNPFSFEITATGLRYRLRVGDTEILASSRPGFRLRPRGRSDVLIEQDVPLAQLAGGVAALLARQPATLDGVMSIRTPRGERHIPLELRGGM